jgi:hypothetical protein
VSVAGFGSVGHACRLGRTSYRRHRAEPLPGARLVDLCGVVVIDRVFSIFVIEHEDCLSTSGNADGDLEESTRKSSTELPGRLRKEL